MNGIGVLRVILGFSVVSTAVHFTHNVVAIDQYPRVSGLSLGFAQVVIAFGWFLFTAFGVLGYRRYVRNPDWTALAYLLVYSLAGLASLGHFLVGPLHIPAFFFATVVTDGLAALSIWLFVMWAATRLAHQPQHVSTER